MRRSDDADFTEFVAGSSRRLLGLAYRLTGDQAAAEAQLQRALERAYRSWPRLNREGVPESFVGDLLVAATTDHRHPRDEAVDLEGPAMDLVSPPADLAARVRAGVRLRRRRLRQTGILVVLLIGVVGVAVANHSDSTHRHHSKTGAPRLRIRATNVEAMAVGGNTLYVAVNAYPRGLLTAYNRATGLPQARAKLPAGPSSVSVGADGTVWVTFYPSNAGRRAGVAEFTPDLRKRSILLTDDHYLDTAVFDVMPLGPRRALLATARGLVTVLLPRVGEAPSVRADRRNARTMALPGRHFGPTTALTALPDGNVAVLLTSDRGQSQVVLWHGSGESAGLGMSVAGSPDGLWVTSGSGPAAVLQRLSTGLVPLPVGEVAHSLSLRGGADRVWANGRTVWVATDSGRITMSCFAFSSPSNEPSGTVLLPVSDSLEAVNPLLTGDVTVVPSAKTLYVASPFRITGYPVPADCQP